MAATGDRSTISAGDLKPLRVRFGAFELDEANARLTGHRKPIALAPKAMAVLCALARGPGRLVTKAALLDEVWGHQHVSESVLKTVVSELRESLGDDPKEPRIIETVPRRGYRFVAAVSPLPIPSEQSSDRADSSDDVPVTDLVGRANSLAHLSRAWQRACGGARQIVWVAGEAGIGKSTLVEHFARGIRDAQRAFGQCVEQHGTAEPYLPVLEALGSLCRTDPSLRLLLRNVAPTWLLQMPWLGEASEREALHRELASVGQERMLREFGELLERYAQQQPLLLVTEDLHWSDHATINLINHLARRRGAARLMWLGTFRLAEIVAYEHPLKALRHELRLHRLCDEIVVEPFSEQDVAAYLTRRLPDDDVQEALVRELHARTDGLPLFLVNVVDDLTQHDRDAGPSPQRVTQSAAGLRIPENLAGVIDKQIARLPAELQRLLQAASVYGVEFRPLGLTELLERDAGWIEASCEHLAGQGHWLAGPEVVRLADGSFDARYAFRHALYRHVLYQGIGAMRRAQWHGRAARWLERHRAAGGTVTAGELAMHYEASHDLVGALSCYADAAQGAMRRFAPREGLTLARHGLDLLDRCPASPHRDGLALTLEAMMGASAAQSIGVASTEAKQAFEQARSRLQAMPGHPLRGLVLHALGIVLLVRGEYAEAIGLGEHMHAIAQQESDPLMVLSACSVLGQAHALQGRNGEACRWLMRGTATCEALGDDALSAAFVVDPAVTIYAALAIPLLHLGRVDEARRAHDTAMVRADRLREPMAALVANWFGALLEVRLGNVARVAGMGREMERLAEDAALAQGRDAGRWFQGWAMAREGAPREGFERIRLAFECSAGLGMRSGGSEVLAYAAEALWLAGDWEGAERKLDEAAAFARSTGEDVCLVPMHILRGRVALGRGEVEAGRSALRHAAEVARSQEAAWLELTALVALCELDPVTADDARSLSALRARFTQGADTPLLKRAAAL